MTRYIVTIDINRDIPVDVLTEHIGAALKQFRTAPQAPATAPVVTVRKLADGGILAPTSRIVDNIVYKPNTTVTGPEYPLLGDNFNGLVHPYVDTLVEYTQNLGKRYRTGRAHPFDGPEVFDDEHEQPEPEAVDLPEVKGPPLAYPYVDRLLAEKFEQRELHRRTTEQPADEGEWDLGGGEHLGED
jgi:hypothetical protein